MSGVPAHVFHFTLGDKHLYQVCDGKNKVLRYSLHQMHGVPVKAAQLKDGSEAKFERHYARLIQEKKLREQLQPAEQDSSPPSDDFAPPPAKAKAPGAAKTTKRAAKKRRADEPEPDATAPAAPAAGDEDETKSESTKLASTRNMAGTPPPSPAPHPSLIKLIDTIDTCCTLVKKLSLERERDLLERRQTMEVQKELNNLLRKIVQRTG